MDRCDPCRRRRSQGAGDRRPHPQPGGQALQLALGRGRRDPPPHPRPSPEARRLYPCRDKAGDTRRSVRGAQASQAPPSFRIFGFSRQGEARTGQLSTGDGAADANLPERWHIRFPADPLLTIGGQPIRGGKAASAVRRINPLDRRGRISRFDPDYGEDIDEAEYERRLLGLSPSRADRPSRPQSKPLPVQERAGYLRSDLSDWRRLEEEWKRIIPAPHLAARIFAVARILERRDSAIDRIVRLVRKSRERLVDLVGQPAPQLVWPRHARSIYRCREVEALVPRSQRLLWRLDTS